MRRHRRCRLVGVTRLAGSNDRHVFPSASGARGEGQAAVEGQGDDEATSTVGQIFLPGVQLTDGNGLATFDTIYPGWYRGRTTQAKAAAPH